MAFGLGFGLDLIRELLAGGSPPPPTGNRWLLEDGTSKWLLEDGTSFWLLEG